MRCRSYVVHGNEDSFADLEESLTWVRHASVSMRRRGMSTDAVPERRLLELNDDHTLGRSVPTLMSKLREWHGLESLAQTRTVDLAADLENNIPVASDHSSNFVVYRNWLRAQGLDPDEDMK